MASLFGFDFSAASGGAVGLNVASGINAFAGAYNSRLVGNANAAARNTVRAAQNVQRRAETGLAAAIRTINNTRRAEAFADQADSVMLTAIRTQEAFTSGRLEQGLKFAEALGAASAQAGARGMGGSSVDVINDAIAGREARLQQAQDEQRSDQQYALLKQRSGIIEQGLQSLDTTPLISNIDYGVDQGPAGNLFTDLTSSLIGNLIGTEEQRKTLQTFLGSIRPQQATTPLPTAVSTPVGRSDVFGQALPSITIN